MWRLALEGLEAGMVRARLEGAGDPPAVDLTLRGLPLVAAAVTRDGPAWRVEAPLPPEALSDGVQTFALRTRDGTASVRLVIQAGSALDEDLVAEVALLREELDWLKQLVRERL